MTRFRTYETYSASRMRGHRKAQDKICVWCGIQLNKPRPGLERTCIDCQGDSLLRKAGTRELVDAGAKEEE